MGKVKEWAFSEQVCDVCGNLYIPWDEKDNKFKSMSPTCSKECEKQYDEVMNGIADEQEFIKAYSVTPEQMKKALDSV